MKKLIDLLRLQRRQASGRRESAQVSGPFLDLARYRELVTTYDPVVRPVLRALRDTRYHSCTVHGPAETPPDRGRISAQALCWAISFGATPQDTGGAGLSAERHALLEVTLLLGDDGRPRSFLCRGDRRRPPSRARLDAQSLAEALVQIRPAGEG
jgi:hypothetical protein